MKNFIWVINKEKIYAYILSVFTVVVLFVMSAMLNKNLENTDVTGANVIENHEQINEENIENIETEYTAVINELVPNE